MTDFGTRWPRKRGFCATQLRLLGGGKDCLVVSVDDRVGASSGIPEADPGWQPSHFQLTTTPERTQGLGRRRDGRVAEGGVETLAPIVRRRRRLVSGERDGD